MHSINLRKSSLLAVFVGLLTCGCQMSEVNTEYNLVPLPASLTPKAGHFQLSSSTTIAVRASQEVRDIASGFADDVKRASGIDLPMADSPDDGAASIVFDSIAGLGPEAYQLSVTSDEVRLSASAPAGFYYGTQTLRQLLPTAIYGEAAAPEADWSLPCVEISDAPQMRYRGAMLDVCRYFSSVDYVKKFIDVMAAHKMNIFHWHLTDDQGWRIEIKRYPKLTEIGSQRSETMVDYFYTHYPFKYDGTPHGGYYTQDEIREVVAYAKSRYITVIPEIELPGHALAAIASYPELSCTPHVKYEVGKIWGVYDQVFCPTETFFQFMEGVMDEVMTLFPSTYIHIGGDECPKTAWKHCAHCQGLIRSLGLTDDTTPNAIDGRKHTKEEKLQSYIVGRVEKYLNSKGRSIIGWDEILEGGLAPNATVMSWRGVEGGMTAAKAGHDAIMTPNPYVYLDHYQEEPEIAPTTIGGYNTLKKTYSYNPVPDDADSLVQRHIIGVQANCWTEYMPTEERRDYQIFPRLIAIAETAWTPKAQKDFASFCRRMPADFDRLELMGVKPCKNFYSVNINTRKVGEGQLMVDLESFYPDAEIRYTTNGSTTTSQSDLYTGPFPLTEMMDVKAAVYANGKRLGKIGYKHLAMSLLTGRDYQLTPDAGGMRGDIIGPNDVLGADTVTLGLTNAKQGNDASSTPWVGISPDSEGKVTFTASFPQSQVRLLRFATLYNAASGILPVSKAVVFLSTDGTHFEQVVEKAFTYEITENTFRGFEHWVKIPAQEAAAVKIVFYSGGDIHQGRDCYSPHDQSVVPSRMALDEIELYP